MFNKARIMFGKDSKIEISHHYGLERFREFERSSWISEPRLLQEADRHPAPSKTSLSLS